MKPSRKHYWLNKTKNTHAHCHIHSHLYSWNKKDTRHRNLQLDLVIHDCSRSITLDFGTSTEVFGPHEITNSRYKIEQLRRALCDIEKTLDKFEEEYL